MFCLASFDFGAFNVHAAAVTEKKREKLVGGEEERGSDLLLGEKNCIWTGFFLTFKLCICHVSFISFKIGENGRLTTGPIVASFRPRYKTRPKKTRPKAKWAIGRVLKTRPQNRFFVVRGGLKKYPRCYLNIFLILLPNELFNTKYEKLIIF